MENWFKEWFSSNEYLSVYQHRDEEDAEKLLELILSRIDLTNDSWILDAACGAGRHSLYLASKGFNVVGFDLSKNLLAEAKRKAQNNFLNIGLFCADFRNVVLQKKFDLILNLFTSFGYFLTDAENFSFAKSAYSLLNHRGIYLLDYFNANYLIRNLISETIREHDGKKIIERRKFENNRVVKEITIVNGGEENFYIESVQLYSKEEIITEFERIGFKVNEILGDYNGSKYNSEVSPRLILFFEK